MDDSGLDGAQGLDSADANKNSSSCDLCPQSRFSHPESQRPGGAGKLSPDEAKEAQREQDSPRSPCELVTELQAGPKPHLLLNDPSPQADPFLPLWLPLEIFPTDRRTQFSKLNLHRPEET